MIPTCSTAKPHLDPSRDMPHETAGSGTWVTNTGQAQKQRKLIGLNQIIRRQKENYLRHWKRINQKQCVL